MLQALQRKTIFSLLSFFLAALLITLPALSLAAIFPYSKASSRSSQSHKKDVLHFKLTTGSLIALSDGSFVGDPADQVASLNQILSSAGKVKTDKLKNTPSQSNLQQKIESALSGYYKVNLAHDVDINSLANQLKALNIIDTVYGEPLAAPAPSSPNLVSLQSYLAAAPSGVGSTAAKAYSGGNGTGVRIFDIEYSWNTNHEDLSKARAALLPNGTPVDPFNDNNHGTAVLGEMVADDNGFGVTGVASGASLALINANNAERGYDPVGALNVAAAYAKAGDIINIDQQSWGPTPDTYDFVPLEWIPEVYDAIKALTANGVTVVEAAGNGYQNLDDATYYGASFPAGKADSGALIVGAGENCAAPKLTRISYSDYGQRVNFQGPGDCVVTTGWYGDLYSAGGLNSYYSQYFNGTSSATPVIAAAAADVSAAYKAKNGVFPTPAQLRDLLNRNSTAQNNSVAGHIGPYPDLARAMAEINPPVAPPKDTNPPSVPKNLKVSLNSSRKPVVSWSASTDNVKVTGYKIYRNGGYYTSVGANATSWINQTIKSRTTYKYQIAAFDAAGNSSALSASVSITTK